MGICPDTIKRLIERFDQQSDQVRSPDYNETQLRIDFVNPMFTELGWDLDNHQGFAEQYREVVHEDRVKVAGQTKAPDYSFRIGGVRKFFLEAKKPYVDIKHLWEPAYQLRRYGWSAKLAVSLLTDFEELAIYDCRIAPKQMEKPQVARREYITCQQYPERWDFIEGTFSKRAVLQGEFDRYCQTAKGRGAQEFDDAFLEEIEEWRKTLASNLALRNESLDEHALNFAVQRIIDRIIFLRICEDRGIEHIGQLQALLGGDKIYSRLFKLFHNADARYNSGLFHFKAEKDRGESPDELTEHLEIDDVALKSILRRLYYPESPYEFTVVSADILGSVYERFLGKIITLTEGHRAKIEEKPEVRKAGGVYYTPVYIVEYIVQQTVGKLLKGKTPKEAAKLKILDPACGSGSFLLGAYQCLLDWHLKWYVADGPDKWSKGKNATLRPGPVGDWRLSIKKRKDILLDNIHGVDIDFQAVEVTKLSLLLRVLEGETAESLGGLWALFRERALPDLGRNIQCGNSLIGLDINSTDAWKEMAEVEQRKVNPFDFERAFPLVFKQSGFDAVIGNPPYVRVTNIEESMRPLLYSRYRLNHRFDIYVAFIERGHSLLNQNGLLGYILPNKFFVADYGDQIRKFLTEHRSVSQVVNFGDNQVFAEATTYCCLLFLSMRAVNDITYIQASTSRTSEIFHLTNQFIIPAANLSAAPWTFVDTTSSAILNRASRFTRLGDLFDIQHGLQTGMDGFFLLDLCKDNKDGTYTVTSELSPKPFAIEIGAARSVVKGLVDLGRYCIRNKQRLVLFPYGPRDGKVLPLPEAEFAKQFPLAWSYVKKHRAALQDRGASIWYAYRRRNYDLQDKLPRILVPSIATRSSFTFDNSGSVFFVGSGGGGGGGYGLNKLPSCPVNELFVLGVLNSKLIDWIIKQSNSQFGHGYYSFNRQFIEPLRIPVGELADAQRQRKIEQYAATMLSLHEKEQSSKLPQDKDRIRREIESTDRRIDELVYELYGLTDEEIRTVEESTG